MKNTFVWMVSGYYILLVLLPLHLVPTFVCGRCLMTICRVHVSRSNKSSSDSPFLVDIIRHSVQPYSLMSSSLPPPLYFNSLASFLRHSIRITCPYQFNILSWTFFEISSTFVVAYFSFIILQALLLRTSIVAFAFLRPPIFFPVTS